MEQLNLYKYLKNSDLSLKWDIFAPNQTFQFHWSDWDMTTYFLQDALHHKKQENLLEYINKIEHELFTKVYIKINNEISTHNIIHLLEEYYNHKNKSWFFKPEHEQTKININNKAFFIKELKWFDKELYKKFIFYSLLKNEKKNFAVRDFRLSTDLTLNDNIKIVQLSKFGLLLELPHDIMGKLTQKEEFQVQIPETNWNFTKKLRFFQLKEIMQDLNWSDFSTKTHYFNPQKLKHMYGNGNVLNIVKDSHYWIIPYKEFSQGKKVEDTFSTIIQTTENHLISEFESIISQTDYKKAG